MCRYALRRLSFLSRFLCSDRVLAQSTLVHSVRVLAVVLAAGILAAGMAQAQAINIDETVTIPPPPHQDYNGHLNIGAGQDGTLNILQGGLVTVENDAVLGNSTGVTGTVNVTGPTRPQFASLCLTRSCSLSLGLSELRPYPDSVHMLNSPLSAALLAIGAAASG